jgi:starch synthase
MPETSPLRVAFVTAELAPFAKTGGLADVSAALPRELHRLGHDVRVFLPFYSRIRESAHDVSPVDFLQDIEVQLGPVQHRFSVSTVTLPDSDLRIYLIDCPAM